LGYLNEQQEHHEQIDKIELMVQQRLLQYELQLHYLLEARQQLLMYELAKMLFLISEYLKEIVEAEVEM
jgi:hypothetical protein